MLASLVWTPISWGKGSNNWMAMWWMMDATKEGFGGRMVFSVRFRPFELASWSKIRALLVLIIARINLNRARNIKESRILLYRIPKKVLEAPHNQANRNFSFHFFLFLLERHHQRTDTVPSLLSLLGYQHPTHPFVIIDSTLLPSTRYSKCRMMRWYGRWLITSFVLTKRPLGRPCPTRPPSVNIPTR